ncbi:Nuclear RNA export factor 1 [Caenorhabditis elegans]|nr:Nuclear RNA export factor 1 [Caenorhabditis elegans]CAR31478.1 Nuclear RNA export factor 1 [Caenorhabditis elegans]|eukprot:NP_001129880.1 Nuclear RNA export factor 1 [Caenorhabditis elegans]
MNRKGFGGHRDAKQLSRTKNRFARLDPDTQSRYEDDDEPAVPVRASLTSASSRGRGGSSRGFGQSAASIANTGVRNADIVYKCRATGAAKKVDAKWLIKQLNQIIENFKPLLWTDNARGDFEWYVRDEDTASTIRANNRRVVHKESGTRVEFYTSKVPAPWMKLKREEIEIIHRVVDKRHNAENRVLDLSNFHEDEEFKAKDMMMNLTKGNVMLTVLDHIDDKYGNIVALSLSNNRIRHLDYASALVSIAKFVMELDLSHNHISTEKELEKFAGLPVERFFFEGNPVVESFTQRAAYISYIHQSFPRCNMLDGVEVQPLVVGPDLDIHDAMPFRAGYYPNPQIRVLVEQFVTSYFDFYDGPDGQRTRRNLHNAYDADASTFSLTIEHLRGSSHARHHNDECFAQYAGVSHNVLKQERFARHRASRSARGAMDIAVALSKLPTSSHMRDTFIVDVFLQSNDLLGFTVQGLFCDGDLTQTPSPSFFSRSFLVSPRENDSVAVISDQLFITVASLDRLEKFKKLYDQSIANGAAVEQVSAVQIAQIGVNGMGFDGAPALPIREEMIKAMCQFSGMIPPFSEKCLADCAWNFDFACQKFNEIKSSVPAEAFAH